MQSTFVKAQWPRFKSNPINGLSCQPLNYVHNWTSPTTIKRKSTIPASMSWRLSRSCEMMWNCRAPYSLGQRWKRRLSWLKATNPCGTLEMVNPRNSGQLFNTHFTTDKVKPERWTTVSLYLNELLMQKCNFRHQVVASTLCLDKHSPRGSCHLDESSMNHTLAQNSHCKFWCEMHRTCKKHPN